MAAVAVAARLFAPLFLCSGMMVPGERWIEFVDRDGLVGSETCRRDRLVGVMAVKPQARGFRLPDQTLPCDGHQPHHDVQSNPLQVS